MDAADFDGASGERMQREDQFPPHALAKVGAVEIAGGSEEDGKQEQAGKRSQQSGSGFGVSATGNAGHSGSRANAAFGVCRSDKQPGVCLAIASANPV